MPSDAATEDLLRFLARLHGHRCPMSILGARLGLAARRALAPEPGVKLRARYHHRTCALDGVQVTTGCTPGNRNLEVVPGGRHRLELGVEEGPFRVAAELLPGALERGRRWSEHRRAALELPEGSEERARREALAEEILAELASAEAARLVRVEGLP